MSKRRVGILLIGLAMLGLLPFLPQVWAYATAQIDQAGTYSVVQSAANNQLITCSIPNRIDIPRRSNQFPAGGVTRDFFRCQNNFNSPVRLNWSIVSGAPNGLTMNGTADVGPNDVGLCRPVTFNSNSNLPNNQTVSIVFKAVSDPGYNPDFIVEFTFQGQVRFNNDGTTGGGCP